MSNIDYTTIFAWARQSLGLSASDTVSIVDADLQTYAASEVSELFELYPCTTDGQGNTPLTGTDLTSFNEAAGLRTGARILLSPNGSSQFAARMTQSKVGPVTETYGNADISALVQSTLQSADKAMMRVGCVKAAQAFVPLADLAGFRRTRRTADAENAADNDGIDLLIIAPTVDPMIIL